MLIQKFFFKGNITQHIKIKYSLTHIHHIYIAKYLSSHLATKIQLHLL
jgi:hypothetical protein